MHLFIFLDFWIRSSDYEGLRIEFWIFGKEFDKARGPSYAKTRLLKKNSPTHDSAFVFCINSVRSENLTFSSSLATVTSSSVSLALPFLPPHTRLGSIAIHRRSTEHDVFKSVSKGECCPSDTMRLRSFRDRRGVVDLARHRSFIFLSSHNYSHTNLRAKTTFHATTCYLNLAPHFRRRIFFSFLAQSILKGLREPPIFWRVHDNGLFRSNIFGNK